MCDIPWQPTCPQRSASVMAVTWRTEDTEHPQNCSPKRRLFQAYLGAWILGTGQFQNNINNYLLKCWFYSWQKILAGHLISGQVQAQLLWLMCSQSSSWSPLGIRDRFSSLPDYVRGWVRVGEALGQLWAEDNKIHNFGGFYRHFVFLLSNGTKPGSRRLLLLVYQLEDAHIYIVEILWVFPLLAPSDSKGSHCHCQIGMKKGKGVEKTVPRQTSL